MKKKRTAKLERAFKSYRAAGKRGRLSRDHRCIEMDEDQQREHDRGYRRWLILNGYLQFNGVLN